MSKPLTSYAKTRRPSQKRIQSPKQSMDSNTILSCRLNASRLQKCIIWYSSNVKDACAIPAPVQTYLQLPKSIIWFHSQNQWLLTPIQAPYATTHHLTRIADYIIFKIYDCNSRSTKQSQVYESISKITPTSAYLRLLKSLSLQLKYHCLKRAANKTSHNPQLSQDVYILPCETTITSSRTKFLIYNMRCTSSTRPFLTQVSNKHHTYQCLEYFILLEPQ